MTKRRVAAPKHLAAIADASCSRRAASLSQTAAIDHAFHITRGNVAQDARVEAPCDRQVGDAKNELLDLEELEEEDLDAIRQTYRELASKARGARQS
jgi:hypothetical protein